jgi:diguanylate cyclase (GGDEF)-like protein
MVDLDHFKRVNDDHGHAVGDELLRFVAGLLDSITRASDSVCRYGGEEFVVIAPETASRPAGVLAERIRVAVCTRSPGASPAGLQTVSIGVAGTDLWGREMLAAELLYGADMALYRAKREGRDRVCTHVTEPEATG